jgi:hypothetical protein
MKILMHGAFVAVAALAWSGATAQAQTDVALSGYRTMTSTSSGFGTYQTPHDSEGALIELRHIVSPLVGFEGALSFNPANQSYKPDPNNCGYVCGQPPLEVSGKTTEFTLDWVASIKSGNLRPFALGGIGFAFTIPGTNPTVNTPIGVVPAYAVNTVVRPVFVYGGGLDYLFSKHWGMRLQVRGNMTKAPQLLNLYPSTTKYTQIYEPTGGVFYRF